MSLLGVFLLTCAGVALVGWLAWKIYEWATREFNKEFVTMADGFRRYQ